MNSCGVDPEEGLSFIWTIQNYNYCFQDSDYVSPKFGFFETSGVKRNLRIRPVRYFQNDEIEIYLERYNSTTESFHLTLETSIRTVKGTYKKIIDEELIWNGNQKCLSIGDVKINKYELKAYINNDSLTIKCRIKKFHEDILATRKCYARTIVGVERTTYNCNLEDLGDFENDPRIDKSLLILSQFPLFTMDLSTTREAFGKNKVEVHIKQIEPKKCFSTCKMYLIDVNGKIAHSVQDECRFDSRREQVWTFPFIQVSKLLNNKNLYSLNGILSLRCEFAVSLGVIYNQVEKTEYGKSNECHLDSYCKTTKLNFTESLKNSLYEIDYDFPGSLKNNLQCFYTEGKFSDLIIRTSKKDFPVHKYILCARSEVFTAMFERDMKENRTGVVEIYDIEEEIVSKMLLFMYTDTFGEDLEWGTASSLYFAADKYGIVALKRKCSDFLKDNFSVTNIYEVLVLADMHRDPELKSAARDFIFENTGEIMDSEEWKKFMENNHQLALETLHSFFRKSLRYVVISNKI